MNTGVKSNGDAAPISLFVSHSTVDAECAQSVVQLLEKTLELHAGSIRCTSIAGYRLPLGADTDEQLRQEIFAAIAFVGLITPASVRSPYVLFELGARWGAQRHLAPILARGATASLLSRPLSALNALDMSDRGQVLQFVEDTAEYLDIAVRPAASFHHAVEAMVLAASRPTEQTSITADTIGIVDRLDDEDVAMLNYIGHRRYGRATHGQIFEALGYSGQRLTYHANRLIDFGMLSYERRIWDNSYVIQQPGRRFLVERGLL